MSTHAHAAAEAATVRNIAHRLLQLRSIVSRTCKPVSGHHSSPSSLLRLRRRTPSRQISSRRVRGPPDSWLLRIAHKNFMEASVHQEESI